MTYTIKETRFDLYCEKCKHWKKKETDDPCWACLENPYNEDSSKPLYFEESEKENG